MTYAFLIILLNFNILCVILSVVRKFNQMVKSRKSISFAASSVWRIIISYKSLIWRSLEWKN